jgi:hypothetical protein
VKLNPAKQQKDVSNNIFITVISLGNYFVKVSWEISDYVDKLSDITKIVDVIDWVKFVLHEVKKIILFILSTDKFQVKQYMFALFLGLFIT